MNLFLASLAFCLAALFALVGVTRAGAWLIERQDPPVGRFIDIAGAMIHYVHVAPPANADLPPVVFIHGASANLNDQMVPLRPELEGRAELLFFDRPGHGWSGRGSGNDTPDGQARTLEEVGREFGVTRERIRQIEAKTLAKLRNPNRSQKLRDYLDGD